MHVGDRIRNRRKELGLSAERVAELMGVSPATIYRYESSAIMNMGIDKLEPIAEVLQVHPAYLMGWSDSPTIVEGKDNSIVLVVNDDIFSPVQIIETAVKYMLEQSGQKDANEDISLQEAIDWIKSTDLKIQVSVTDKLSHYNISQDEASAFEKYRDLSSEEKGAVQAIFDYVCKVHDDRVARAESNIIELPLLRPTAKKGGADEYVELFKPYQAYGAGSQDDIGDRGGEPVRVQLSSAIRKADFVVTVIGDSMEPTYPDGCMVAIMETQDLHAGDIGAFIVDGEHLVKKVGEGKLVSLNTDYDPIELDEYTEVYTIGKVLGVIAEE